MFEIANNNIIETGLPFVRYKDARLLARYSDTLLSNFVINAISSNRIPFDYYSMSPSLENLFDIPIRIMIFKKERFRDKNILQIRRIPERAHRYSNHILKFEYFDVYVLECIIYTGKRGGESICDEFQLIVTSEELRHHQLASFNKNDVTPMIDGKIISYEKHHKIVLHGYPFYVLESVNIETIPSESNGFVTDKGYKKIVILSEKEFARLKLSM